MSVHIRESSTFALDGAEARYTACHRTIIDPVVTMVDKAWIKSGARRAEVNCARCRAKYGLAPLPPRPIS